MMFLRRYPKNTALARKLARHYERLLAQPFPGGVENATITRCRPGYWQRTEGAWSWILDRIDHRNYSPRDHLVQFGSQNPAREAAKHPELLEWIA